MLYSIIDQVILVELLYIISSMSYFKQSEGLNHHGLESFLLDIVSKTDIHSYEIFLSHPHINTVDKKYVKLIELFCYGTYATFMKNKTEYVQLKDQQIRHLKMLTILSLFEGVYQVSIDDASEAIMENKTELFRILIKMSIDGLITIKIDEENNKILILNSKRRDISEFNSNSARAKIQRITNKNQEILRDLKDLTQIK